MYRDPFPATRPRGLRRRRLATGTELWRIDRTPPEDWTWDGFATPRFRLDPASGTFRVRYASTTVAGAARERYLDTGRLIPADHHDHHLVRLVAQRPLWVLDLRTETTLDTLGLDDRVSTSHEPDVWDACHRLADAARGWWADLDGVVYRSRTTPATANNLAFFSLDGITAVGRSLDDCGDELDQLVIHHQFTIRFAY